MANNNPHLRIRMPAGATRQRLTIDERLDAMKPNLAPNANPFSLLLVKAIEVVHRVDIERVRDAWGYIVPPPEVEAPEQEPTESMVATSPPEILLGRIAPPPEVRIMMFVAIGGLHRRQHKDCWKRLKDHPLFAGDVDSMIVPHATIAFTAPEPIAAALRAVVTHIPAFSMTPEQKQDQAREYRMTGCTQGGRPSLPQAEVKALLGALAFLVENLAPTVVGSERIIITPDSKA